MTAQLTVNRLALAIKQLSTRKNTESVKRYYAVNALANNTYRMEKLHGKEYLVKKMTMIVPGVLNGSKGALFYPPEEITTSMDRWNGMPIVAYHPQMEGKHISARRPDVLNKQGLGYVFNSTVDNSLQAEAWFDVEAVRNYDKNLPLRDKIFPRLILNKAIELSTGLMTTNYVAPKGSNWNGKPYTHVARHYQPDHLAILPDQKGACSIKDGCGVYNTRNRSGFQHSLAITLKSKLKRT